MSRRRGSDGTPPSIPRPNGLREFFRGPIHLLILKVPLLIIGTIFFVAYLIVKHTIIQTSRFIYSAIASIPHLLKSSTNYLILIYHKIPEYARYLSEWFYTKILIPIRFFLENYILWNMCNAMQWIGKKIVSLSVEFYRSILQPIGQFCYICAVERFPQCIDDLLAALFDVIRLLVTKLSSTCLWLWHNILHPLCSAVNRYLLLPTYRIIAKILSYICNEVVPAATQFLKLTARTTCHWWNQLILHRSLIALRITRFFRDTAMMLHQHVLSPMYVAVETAISYATNVIVIPCYQWTIQLIKTISYHSFIALFRALIHISETIIRLYQAILYLGTHYWLWLHHVVRKVYTFIVDDFFPAALLLAKRIARFIGSCANYLLRNVYPVSSGIIPFFRDTATVLYQGILSPMYAVVVTSVLYATNVIVIPCYQRTIQMIKTISYHSFVALSRASIYLSNLIMRIYYTFIFIIKRYRSSVYDMLTTIWILFYHEILPTANQFMKRSMKTIWNFSNQLIRYSRLILLQTIRFIRDSSTTLYEQILLPLYGTVATLTIYITKEILQPLGKWTIQMVSVASTAIMSIVHTVIQACHAAALFCRHQGLQVCYTVVNVCSLIYGEIMKMVNALNMQIKPVVRFKFYERIFHPIGGALYENSQIFYQSTLVPLGHAMSAMGPIIVALLNALKKIMSDGLYELRQAIAALSAALVSMFRSITESSRRLLAR